MKNMRKLSPFLLILLSFLAVMNMPTNTVLAQNQPGDIINCLPPVNISQSPGYSSVDPFMLTDQAGNVHLFWGERITGKPDEPPNMPEAVMHSFWNGTIWSKPQDLFLSPPEYANKRINAIRGVIDDNGTIHLIWIGPDNTFFYSSAHASHADQFTAWQTPQMIAFDQSAAQYSADIGFSSPGTVHIVYGREPDEKGNQTVTHILSEDGGKTWSEPQTIYTVPYVDRGASNIRLWVTKPDTLFVTWTEWDISGNGQAVFVARSLNNGKSWQPPVMLAERLGQEYERDWTTLAPLGDDELVAIWEGGYRAYRQAQYSQDGGATWSQPIDTLDWLIADNGFAELLRDGADRLHLFVFQRVREGNEDRNAYGADSNGLWHSVWEGGTQWRQPEMIGEPNPGNFVTAAMRGGNQLFAAWFSYVDLELSVIQCELYGTPAVPLQPWTEIPPLPVSDPLVTPTVVSTQTASLAPTAALVNSSSSFPITPELPPGPANSILLGIVPVFAIIILVALFNFQKRRHTR